jgi:phenylacetate-coenzyme A ligase PaaK-like adenylate-forming protein
MNLARIIPVARADFAAASEYLRRRDRDGAEGTSGMQLDCVRAVWADAVADVPFYARLASEGKAPRRIESWDDFRSIPVLDRGTIRENQEQFIRRSSPPDQYMQTAGSTGNPIRFGVWGDEGAPQRIVKQATWIECGYRLGDSILLLWGHSHLLGSGWRRWVNHAKRVSKDWLIGYHRANAYTLGPEACLRIARWIIGARPVGVIGYGAALDLFARHAAGMGDEVRDELRGAGVRFVISTAEPPPRADSFDLLRGLFGGCTIVEEFGGVEFGQLGVRCDEKQWRIFPELNILEASVERDDPEGHRLLVTTLYRRYMPFVRYLQGDVIDGPQRLDQGQLGGFERLAGRAADMFLMPDGRSVHSVAFFHCTHQEPAVLNIQMVIEDAGPRLRLVVGRAPDAGLEARIRARLRQVHPALESAPLEYVQDLATNVAGKRRWFVDRRTH